LDDRVHVLRDQSGGKLNIDGRITLIVLHHEMHRPAVNAAARVDRLSSMCSVSRFACPTNAAPPVNGRITLISYGAAEPPPEPAPCQQKHE